MARFSWLCRPHPLAAVFLVSFLHGILSGRRESGRSEHVVVAVDGVFVGVRDRRPVDQLALFGRVLSPSEQGFDPLKGEAVDFLLNAGPLSGLCVGSFSIRALSCGAKGWTLLTRPRLVCFCRVFLCDQCRRTSFSTA